MENYQWNKFEFEKVDNQWIKKSVIKVVSSLFHQQIVLALFGCTLAAPQVQQGPTTEPIPIISQEQEINYDGSYKWAYETGNGIQAEEQGYQKEIPGQEEKANVS